MIRQPVQALPWEDAVLAAALLAVDPAGLGGVVLRARVGPLRDEWLGILRDLLPETAPVIRVPLSVTDDRLLGGLDLGATLQSGVPVVQRGLLAAADGGVALLPMAERISLQAAGRIAAAQDRREVVAARDGVELRSPARFGFVALDEGVEPDEAAPPALADRAAFLLALDDAAGAADFMPAHGRADIAQARRALPAVAAAPDHVGQLCELAAALGVGSLRAPLAALRVACARAALEGRTTVIDEDLVVAGRLVLAPRATRCPVPAEPEHEEPEEAPPPPDASGEPEQEEREAEPPDAVERLVEAIAASLPAGLLATLALASPRRALEGRAGAPAKAVGRGRPIGNRPGRPSGNQRLDLVATLRAALGLQRLRRQALSPGHPGHARRVLFREDDLRIRRNQSRTATLVVFVVDASGSLALQRLGEAKGAVELLLADCYARRDEVALVAFRGQGAELVLPPTRSLARAKRTLAGLVGGGGTPLASGLDVAASLVEASRRKGRSPVLVILTDGRANVARDGSPGRPKAAEDALCSARALRAAGATALLIDTSPSPQPGARAVADAMAGTYIPLPHADARDLSRVVRTAAPFA
ncbi:MAG: magnesium chelatase subunit D [Alsobacter sp.]